MQRPHNEVFVIENNLFIFEAHCCGFAHEDCSAVHAQEGGANVAGADCNYRRLQSHLMLPLLKYPLYTVMLVLGLGLGLKGLALAKNSRPKSWPTTKFTINFHGLEHGDWSELYFKIHVPYLLTVGNHGLVRVLEKKQDFIIFIVIVCIMGWSWPWHCCIGLDSIWPWP